MNTLTVSRRRSMEIQRHSGVFIAPDSNISLRNALVSIVDDKIIYVLDNVGFKAEFKNKWISIRNTCIKWAECIVARNNHLHSDTDFTKYENLIRCVAMADLDMKQKKLEEFLALVFKGNPSRTTDKIMYTKVLLGGKQKKVKAKIKVRRKV